MTQICYTPTVGEEAVPIVHARAARVTLVITLGVAAVSYAIWSSNPNAVLLPAAFVLGWLNLVGL